MSEHRLHVRPDGMVWMKYIDDYGEREVHTVKKYPEIYRACCSQRDFGSAFRISEYGHVLHTRGGNTISVGRLRKPLIWEDGYNDDRYKNTTLSSNAHYDGLVYGIRYTLRLNGNVTFHDDQNKVLQYRTTLQMIRNAVKYVGITNGGSFYVKDNGVMIGVFGQAGRRIYIGRLIPPSNGHHHWNDWFPNMHQEIPYLD